MFQRFGRLLTLGKAVLKESFYRLTASSSALTKALGGDYYIHLAEKHDFKEVYLIIIRFILLNKRLR